ncbi:hypothetical protein T4E_7845, partial [Trichinella pseudospiralis]
LALPGSPPTLRMPNSSKKGLISYLRLSYPKALSIRQLFYAEAHFDSPQSYRDPDIADEAPTPRCHS